MKKQTSANGLYTANTDERNGLSSEQQSRIKERVANGAKHYTIEDLRDTIRRGARACKLAQRIAPWVSEKVELTGNLLRDYWNGIYRELPWTTIAALGFAIAYLLNPFDLIPDFVPGLGLLDDAATLALVFKAFSYDLQAYAEWKSNHEELQATCHQSA